MANNKMYENYLMHYRTPGSKNGYTKYPGKYTPIGEKAMAPLASITESHKIKYPESLEKPTLNSVFNGITKGATPTSQRQREAEARRIAGGSQGTITRAEAARRANQQAAEERRIKGGGLGTSKPKSNSLLAGGYGHGTFLGRARAVAASNYLGRAQNNDFPNTMSWKRKKEITDDAKRRNQKAAEQRRIAGGNVGVGSGISASQRQKEAEARRIAGGNPYVNQREENRKAAEARRIAGGNGVSASQRQKEAGGTQGTITTAEAKRKNINDWYSGQVRGGNQSAAEARRIKGGTQGVKTTAQAAAENAESERKKKKLKGVLKALLKSKSHGISRFF